MKWIFHDYLNRSVDYAITSLEWNKFFPSSSIVVKFILVPSLVKPLYFEETPRLVHLKLIRLVIDRTYTFPDFE